MNIKLADRLVSLRKENKLSQEALAEKLGLSRQSISKWERAEASPDTDNLIALAELYGMSLDELLGNEPVKSEKTEKAEKKKDNKSLKLSPILFLVAVAVYAVGGIAIGGKWWGTAWVLFTLVLSFALYSASKSVAKRGVRIALTTVSTILATASIYVLLGMLFSLWNMAWIVFLLIPAHIYISVIKK
jgi:transcriptional regulator with XRE-family HTH domain